MVKHFMVSITKCTLTNSLELAHSIKSEIASYESEYRIEKLIFEYPKLNFKFELHYEC